MDLTNAKSKEVRQKSGLRKSHSHPTAVLILKKTDGKEPGRKKEKKKEIENGNGNNIINYARREFTSENSPTPPGVWKRKIQLFFGEEEYGKRTGQRKKNAEEKRSKTKDQG